MPTIITILALTLVQTWTDPSPHTIERVRTAPGVELEVLYWGGEGPPVVFLAGYGNTAHVFDDFATQFTASHRVVGLTRRGFGRSSLPTSGYDNRTLVNDILAVMDSLHIQKASFVAHSFGGSELNGLAVSHPERVQSLGYLDAGFDFAGLYADSVWVKSPTSRPPLADDFDGSVKANLAFMSEMAGPGYPESEVRVTAEWFARPWPPGFFRDSLPAWLMRGSPAIDRTQITAPALAIFAVPRTVREKYPWYDRLSAEKKAEADRRFASESVQLTHQRERFRREMKRGTVLEIQGARHYVFLTNRAQVLAEVKAFLR